MDLREQLQKILGETYTIERELGGGGMSRVFVARETALGREVVVKVLPPELAGELSAERFRREIQLAARLQHPHIVTVLSAGTGAASDGLDSADRMLYYTMPLVEGETLRSRLSREGELPVADVVRVARELSDALAYAHERGVVHRDLKPENILMTRGHAMVADFGVAKAVTASVKSGDEPRTFGLTSVGLALGTPAYMAPEQAAADPATDHRADIYALGCVLYELLAGTPPFFGRPTQALLAAHLAEVPEPIARRRPATPLALAMLVMRMLEKRPADRPQTANEVYRSVDVVGTPTAVSEAQVVSGMPATTAGTFPGSVVTETSALSEPQSRTAWRVGLIGGLVVGIGLVAAAVAVIGGRRAASFSAENANTVAIAPFETPGGSPELASAAGTIVDYLADALSSVDSARIVRGSATGARYTITGTLDPGRGDSAVLRARLVDGQSGTVLRVFTPARLSVSAPLDALESLRSRVQGALGIALHPMLGPGALPRTDAPTAEAFAEVATGLAQMDRGFSGLQGDLDRAADHMQRAVSLDSSFLLPVILKAVAESWGESGDVRVADASLDSLLRTAGNRLSPHELALLDWARAGYRGDRAGLLRAATGLYTATPVPWTRHQYARALIDVGRYRAGIAVFDTLALTANADFPEFWNIYTQSLHLAGDHSRELAAARKAKLLMPDRQGVRAFEIKALIALDSAEAALRALEVAFSLPEERDTRGAIPLVGLAMASMEFRVHGRPDIATALGRRFLTELAAARGIRLLNPAARERIATASANVGNDSAAFAIAREIVLTDTSRLPSVSAQRAYGVAAAKLGDTITAERMMQRIDSLIQSRQPFAGSGGQSALARIAAALGRDDDALRFSAAAVVAAGHGFRSAAHSLPEFAVLRRNPKFQSLLKLRSD